ncbi:EH signature domain-containing protein [Bradyrhizobium sp. CB82]|uniref:EH signature domain-containing protein n=1 Tax=Bradyrhizobium sp. CB82 TaxID=3039159 RepID=UPI0024B05C91|nr:EH signature domain-containing protein [Bradyrhizobium sp. CB82]WFU42743.1 EH signature domain-containing protein [Bradyrhizobium sp. CB82]
MSLSERVEELKALRTLVRAPRLPDRPRVERIYDDLCKRYEEIRRLDKVDYAVLLEKLRSAARAGDLSSLSLRDMRLSASCLFDGEAKLADDPRFLELYLGALRSIRSRLAIKRLIHAYCAHFDEKHPGIRQIGMFLREIITTIPTNGQWLWPERHQLYGLFNPMQVSARLCDAIMKTSNPRKEMELAGLSGPLLSGGLSSAVFLNALVLTEHRLKSDPMLEDVDRVIAWAKSDTGGLHYSAHRGAIANALLTPWARSDPDPAIKDVIQRFLIENLSDPRIDRGAWLGTRQAALETIIRWLAQATLEQFLKVVDRVAERHQWDYRRAFWSAYIERGFVANAWVAFGSNGAHVARKIAEATSDQLMNRFGTLGGAGPDQAVLLLSIGDLIVADWSHNGRLRIWRRGNAAAPKFNSSTYVAVELRKDSDFDIVHSPPDGWQGKAESYIRRHTGIRLAEHEYLPRRGKR